MSINQVNEDNFNDTCRGYLQYALDRCEELNEYQRHEVKRRLYYAFDVLTMEDAREYLEKTY